MKNKRWSFIIAAAVCIAAAAFSRYSFVGDLPAESEQHRTDIAPEELTAQAVALHNKTAAEAPLEIPTSAVRLYISADDDTQKIAQTLERIKVISDEVCTGLDSDIEKLCALSQYVSENYYYDYDASETSVTEETICLAHTLDTRRTVCIGFANLFAALCQAQGIDCRVVHGTAQARGTFSEAGSFGRLHEWNIALIGGEMIWVDPLWNTSNAYKNGKYVDGSQHTSYLCISDEELAQDHRASHTEIRDYFSVIEE